MRRSVEAAAILVLVLAPWAQAQGPGFADLVASAPAMIPAQPAEADPVLFNATISNQGFFAAGNVYVVFFVDERSIASFGPLFLMAGQRINLSNPVPWTATPGPHTFRAEVDPADLVVEGREDNNVVELPFEVAELADLRVAELRVDPAGPRVGDEVAVHATLENLGPGNAGAFRARLAVDATEVLNVTVPGLAAGERINLTGNWTARLGPHAARATADVLDHVPERNEANNEAVLTFNVGPPDARPDLTVIDLRLTPSAPVHGDDVLVEALVRNVGGAAAPASLTRFEAGGDLLGDAATPTLAAGAEVWVAAPDRWPSVAGTHTARAEADAPRLIGEEDEGNNARSEEFAVAPAPGLADLLVVQVEPDPASPREGEPVTFQATVRNAGSAATGPFRLDFHLDQQLLGSATVQGLAGGASTIAASPSWPATRGSHVVRAVADAAQQVPEANEANNEAALAFSVRAPLPNLVVGSLRSAPDPPVAGSSATLQALVRNQGDAAAGPFQVAFRIDGRPVGSVAVPGLTAGAERLVESPAWTAEAGQRLARAVADASGEVAEAHEDDNERLLTLGSLTPLPNLVVERLALEGAAPQPDGEARFVATVANLGSAPSAAAEVRFELGADAARAPLAALAAGQRVTVSSDALDVGRGAQLARAAADPDRRVAELNEEDNEATLRFDAGAPLAPTQATSGGLTLGTLRLDPASPAPGQAVRVRVEVRNGGAALLEDVEARLMADGVEVDRVRLDRLQPAQGVTVLLRWTAEEGTHTLEVEALRAGDLAASSAPQTVRVAAAGEPAPVPEDAAPFELALILLLALAVIGLAAYAASRRAPR